MKALQRLVVAVLARQVATALCHDGGSPPTDAGSKLSLADGTKLEAPVAATVLRLASGVPGWRHRAPVTRRQLLPRSAEAVQDGAEGADAHGTSPKTCDVCWEQIRGNHPAADTACGHSFHETCIQSWKDTADQVYNNHCPKCRAELPGPPGVTRLEAAADRAEDHADRAGHASSRAMRHHDQAQVAAQRARSHFWSLLRQPVPADATAAEQRDRRDALWRAKRQARSAAKMARQAHTAAVRVDRAHAAAMHAAWSARQYARLDRPDVL